MPPGMILAHVHSGDDLADVHWMIWRMCTVRGVLLRLRRTFVVSGMIWADAAWDDLADVHLWLNKQCTSLFNSKMVSSVCSTSAS